MFDSKFYFDVTCDCLLIWNGGENENENNKNFESITIFSNSCEKFRGFFKIAIIFCNFN